MIKKIAFLGILGILLGLFGWIFYQNQQKSIAKKQIGENIRQLPDFEFENVLENEKFTNESLSDNKTLLLIYFNSECEHCQYEVAEICKHAHQFTNKQVVLVSSQDMETIQNFAEEHQLSKYPFIRVAKTEAETFYKTFGTTAVPSVFIYNDTQELIKQFKGEVKIETLLKYPAE